MKATCLLSTPILACLFTGTALAQIQVLNATIANGAYGLPEYGSLAAVSCAGLSGIVGTIQATQYPLPTQLAGVSVTVNGTAAPLLAITDMVYTQQITFQMPVDRTSVVTMPVVVSQFNQSGQSTFDVQPYRSWSFFFPLPPTFPYFGTPDSAFVQHADYSAVTYDHPAQPGEVVIVYGTNLTSYRAVHSAPPLGSPAPSSSNVQVLQTNGQESFYTFWVNGQPTEVQYMGLAPGQVGVFQINFRVPNNTPDGNAILLAVSVGCST